MGVLLFLVLIVGGFVFYSNHKKNKQRNEFKSNGFIVMDFETTGLHPAVDEIIQAAAVLYVDGKEVDHFVSYVKPKNPIPSRITSINGITNKDVENAPAPNVVFNEFLKFIQGYPVVGHNIAFDLGFLNKYAPNYQPPAYDTLAMSRKVNSNFNNHKLTTLKEHYNLPGRSHDALDDSRVAGEVFLRLLERTAPLPPERHQYGKKKSPHSHLQELQDIENTCSFSTEDYVYMDLLRSLTEKPISFNKTNKYLVLSYCFKEICRIKHGGRLQYILFPGGVDEYKTLSLEVVEPPKSEEGYARILFGDVSDLIKIKEVLSEKLSEVDQALSLFEWEYAPRDRRESVLPSQSKYVKNQ